MAILGATRYGKMVMGLHKFVTVKSLLYLDLPRQRGGGVEDADALGERPIAFAESDRSQRATLDQKQSFKSTEIRIVGRRTFRERQGDDTSNPHQLCQSYLL